MENKTIDRCGPGNQDERKRKPSKLLPYKLLYQNIQGLVTANSKLKKVYFDEYTSENNVIMLNLTETWLNESIVEDAKINDYQIFRSDRRRNIRNDRGGAVIYLSNQFEANEISNIGVQKCEMIAIEIEKLNTINIVIYRPPDTTSSVFLNIIKELKKILSSLESPEPTIIISGDFNFPFVKWIRDTSNGCRWEIKPNSCSKIDEKSQFNSLISLFDKYNLVQVVEEPTREKNTLDLIFTNDINIFTDIEVTKSNLSDHNLIELTTNYNTNMYQTNTNEAKNFIGEPEFWHLNFHHENVSWPCINEEINKIQWQEMFNGKDTETCTNILMECLLILCFNLIPLRKKQSKSKVPKERKKMLNRLKMLKRNKHRTCNNTRKKIIEKKILETESKIIEHRKQERYLNESRVIEKMEKNPKVLFDYIKKQKNRDTKIGPFKIGNEYIHDSIEICNLLVKQYNSQFSNGGDITEVTNEIFNEVQDGDLTDIQIKDDIVNAIGKLNINSAAGPDGLPAIFLINTKDSIKTPLEIILRKSIDEGKIPDVFKLAYVIPIHKGGSKLKPEQYRPVSLTSHLMKVFERVIKRNILAHLLEHNLINPSQHGFVPGRSTQTQLLQHYCDIFETIEEGSRIDTIFLDFSKAFDKVNHDILLQKVAKHKIKGKIGIWLKEFLSNRKYRVVANGEKSDIQDVLSGVPQGTVLAALLFVIMISDIDEKVKNSIIRCFADDTKISSKIKSEEDKVLLQKDLQIIYEWANENLMEFNENKFEQMSHGVTTNINVDPYKTPSGNLIKPGKIVKDLGVLANNNLLFKEHIDKIVTSSKIMSGVLLRTFSTRQAGPMMKMFNSYLRSKLEYCSLVWSPWHQNEISKLERVQKNFTSRIDGLEPLNYHQRLKKLNLYSLERRRERYLIINAWQQIEGQVENILNLKARRTGRIRSIISRTIPLVIDGKRIKERDRTLIHYSTARKMERLFNLLPPNLRNITGVTTDTFKKHLDKWLVNIPDTPKIDDYGMTVAAESNSIIHQVRYTVNN